MSSMSCALALVVALGATFAHAAPLELDPSFDGDGRVFESASAIPLAGPAPTVAVQADGKIVTAASTGAVYRFEGTGSLDSSFGVGGVVTTASDIRDVAIQADGRIIVVGGPVSAPTTSLQVRRLDADGSPDTTFGVAGMVDLVVDSSDTFGRAVLIQDDGKILIAGNVNPGVGAFPTDEALLVRLETDGALDATFGTAGVVVGGDALNWWDVVVQQDGRIVVAGTNASVWFSSDPPANSSVLVSRYLADGTLDTSFASGGTLMENPDNSLGTGAMALALQSDDKIVVAANATGLVVLRLDPDGSLDTTFAGDGIARVDAGFNHFARDVDIAGDGSMLVVGGNPRFLKSKPLFTGVRLLADGTLDPTLTPCVQIVTAFPEGNFRAIALARQPDGKLVVAGGDDDSVALARYQDGVPRTCAAASKAKVKAKAGSRDSIVWNWKAPPPFLVEDFGDPTTSTGFTLCAIDEGGAHPVLNDFQHVFGGDLCQGSPCWKATAAGFRYKRRFDAFGRASRTTVKLIASAGGGNIKLKTDEFEAIDGRFLPTAPVTTRLLRSDGVACWEAVFPVAGKDDGRRFVAKIP